MNYNFLCLEILLLSNTTEIIKMPTEVTLSLGFLKLYSLTKQFGLGIFISVGKCKRVCAGKCESWGISEMWYLCLQERQKGCKSERNS